MVLVFCTSVEACEAHRVDVIEAEDTGGTRAARRVERPTTGQPQLRQRHDR